MTSKFTPLLAILLGTLPVAAQSGSAEDVTMTGFMATAKQDGPLEIVGFKLPERAGPAPRLVVRNVSSKHIAYFTVQRIAGKMNDHWADLNGPTDIYLTLAVSESSRFDRSLRAIPPGGQVEVDDVGIPSPGALGSAGKGYGSNCAHVLVMAYRVEFADGTDWKWSPTYEQIVQLWRGSIRREELASCSDSPRVKEIVKKLDGSAVASRGNPNANAATVVQRYSVSCSVELQKRGSARGKLLAVCQ